MAGLHSAYARQNSATAKSSVGGEHFSVALASSWATVHLRLLILSAVPWLQSCYLEVLLF